MCVANITEALDDENIWFTSSLRGVATFDLTVRTTRMGNHSGLAGGIVPDTLSIVHELLGRLEGREFGTMIDVLNVDIPESARVEAKSIAGLMGD